VRRPLHSLLIFADFALGDRAVNDLGEAAHAIGLADRAENTLAEERQHVVRQRITENIETTERLLHDSACVWLIARMAEAVAKAVERGKKVLIFGNGGSAADAQHISAELLGRYLLDRRALPAVALADCSAAVTAIGNDYAYADIFSRQISGLGAPGDVAIGISTSGTSVNVIRGLQTARANGLTTMALTGAREGPLSELADFCLKVPTPDTPRIQECYMVVAHTICELVEQTLDPPGAE
jgi:D-sedoheptulose 7-phosphate isomerase